MTEIFSAVSGAIGIAALFNNCVDCFEYVQIARNFGRDYRRYQLRLDVAKCRLGRWGTAIDINNDPRFRPNSPGDESVTLAKNVLKEIVGIFESAYKISHRYEQGIGEQDRSVFTDVDFDAATQLVHSRFRAVTKRRQNRTSLMRKTVWALYDKKQLGEMIDSIVSFTEELENIFPIAQFAPQLAEMEIEEIDDEQSLRMIQSAAQGVDPALEEMAGQKLRGIVTRNSAGNIRGTGLGGVNVGNTFTREELSYRSPPHDTTSSVGDIDAGERSRINIGNTYGAGRGFWD